MLKTKPDTALFLPEAWLCVGRWHVVTATMARFARKQPWAC